MLVAQKEASTDEPGVNDLFTVGTVASILQMLKLHQHVFLIMVHCSFQAANGFFTPDKQWNWRTLN